MKIAIVNGPNLNLLGKREPHIYGSQHFEEYIEALKKQFADSEITYFQSNIEGEIINHLHEIDRDVEGIVLNPASYSHTSVGIADAIAAIDTPVIEVHISNIYARENYRHVSLTAKNCQGVLTGFGMKGYELAIHHIINLKA